MNENINKEISQNILLSNHSLIHLAGASYSDILDVINDLCAYCLLIRGGIGSEYENERIENFFEYLKNQAVKNARTRISNYQGGIK